MLVCSAFDDIRGRGVSRQPDSPTEIGRMTMPEMQKAMGEHTRGASRVSSIETKSYLNADIA